MRKKCSYADRYKATRAPKCGCEACATKWNNKVQEMTESAAAEERGLAGLYEMVWSRSAQDML